MRFFSGRPVVRGLSLSALLLGLPLAGAAQTIASGILAGVVLDAGGQPLADVEITVTDQEAGGARTFTTGRDGAFRFALLPPGSYLVRAERLGFRPRHIQAVPIRAGEQLEMEVRLTMAARPEDVVIEAERFEGSGSGSRAGVSQWLSTLRLDALPWDRRELAEIAGLSTIGTRALEIEGLPASLNTLMIDGIPYAPIRHPDLDRSDHGVIALPLSAFESAELVTADPDMDWSGFAGGALAVHTRRGASALSGRSFGSWSGGPLRSSQAIEGTTPANTSLWGGVLLGGPILTDTAHFAFGFEARRLETPRPRPWALDGSAGAVVAAGHDAYSVGLEAYTRPYVLQTTVASGFGRFDWLVGNGNVLSVRAGFGGILPVGRDTEIARAAIPGAVAEGGDMLLSASLSSPLREDWAHEIRIGVTRGTREFEPEAAIIGGASALPSTRVIEGGLHFGADARLPASFRRTGFTTAQSLELSTGDHRLKFGLETEVAAHDDAYAYGRRGEFLFGSASDFASGRGAFVQTDIPSPQARFTRLGFGAYVQDSWNAAPGLRVVGGLRFDVESFPAGEIRLNQRWLAYTGIANVDVPKRVVTLSPRIGLTWDVGGQGLWTVRASAGVYGLDIQPELISELIALDGTPNVRRGFGDVGAWPSIPGAGLTSGYRLTLLGPDFRGPLTGRASFGVSHHVADGTTLHLSASYRETEFLPRRSDLNRLAQSNFTDQHGRPLFGPLVQAGELVGSPNPNRRFADFDVVSAINADGWSRYWGVTAAVEHDAGEALGLFARYTYSRTTDNWLASSEGGPDAQLSPFPGDAVDWREGTSDYDLPHNFAAGAELRLPGAFGPRVAAVYRFRSGYPFTPGFRAGVDVNGDGSGRNDPAFVDASISGVQNLVAEWDCLRSQLERFAERNSCRAPSVHSLDVRAGLQLVRASGVSAELYAEGLNLVDPAFGERDTALYRIDASRSLVQNPSNGTVTIPLIANPDFGRLLGRDGSGRTLRLGVQVVF